MGPGSTFDKVAENSQCVKHNFRPMAQKLCATEENYFSIPGCFYVCVSAYKPYIYSLCTKYVLEIWLKPFLLSVCKFDILISELFYSMILTSSVLITSCYYASCENTN